MLHVNAPGSRDDALCSCPVLWVKCRGYNPYRCNKEHLNWRDTAGKTKCVFNFQVLSEFAVNVNQENKLPNLHNKVFNYCTDSTFFKRFIRPFSQSIFTQLSPTDTKLFSLELNNIFKFSSLGFVNIIFLAGVFYSKNKAFFNRFFPYELIQKT